MHMMREGQFDFRGSSDSIGSLYQFVSKDKSLAKLLKLQFLSATELFEIWLKSYFKTSSYLLRSCI